MFLPDKDVYEFGEFRLDITERILSRQGERVQLGEKAFETLCALVRHSNRLVSKSELMSEVWSDTVVEENNLDKNISYLRRVLEDGVGRPTFIETVRGHGYRFSSEVRRVTETGLSAEAAPAKQADSAGSETNSSRGSGFGISEPGIKDEELTAEKSAGPKNPPKRKRWFVMLAVLSVLSLGTLVFYLAGEQVKLSNSPIKSIAVLPFRPLLSEERDEALEIGMADTLISRLGANREVIVLPLSSVRKFSSLEQDAVAAGRELGVESILDGSLQRSGDKIRVNVRLISIADGSLLWTGTFDEKFTNIFIVQDAISNRVAEALEVELIDDKTRAARSYTENVEAYGLYLKGRYHSAKLTRPGLQTGISHFQQAVEIDPTYAIAYVGLAESYRGLVLAGEMPPNELFPKAKAAALKAIEIDDRLADAHAILGFILFWYDWNWQESENQCKRALELSPNNADAHMYYAHLLSNTGYHAEALAEIKRAGELDPLSARIKALEGQFLLHGGQIDAALAQSQETFELDQNFWLPHLYASSAYIEKGMFPEALSEARIAKALSGASTFPAAHEGYALAKSGKPAEARIILTELLKQSGDSFVSPYNIALIYNGLEERNETIIWLERGFEEREPKMVFLKVEPKWNNLRSDPRFMDLMKRMNF